MWTNINFWPPILPGLTLICWMTFYKLVLTSGLQVGEMQPSFVSLLEGFAIGTEATRKGGSCMIWLSLLLKSYISSTHLLLLKCFCFCKMFSQGFLCLLPDAITVYPCTTNPKGQMNTQYNSLFLPWAGCTALFVRQCASLCCSGSVLTHTSGASDPQDMAFSALAARMWPRFLLNGPALRRKVPNQHSSAADTAQTDCLQILEPLSPWGSVIEISALVTRGETCCTNPLCFSAKSHLSGEVTTASAFAVLSSLSSCSWPAFFLGKVLLAIPHLSPERAAGFLRAGLCLAVTVVL